CRDFERKVRWSFDRYEFGISSRRRAERACYAKRARRAAANRSEDTSPDGGAVGGAGAGRAESRTSSGCRRERETRGNGRTSQNGRARLGCRLESSKSSPHQAHSGKVGKTGSRTPTAAEAGTDEL